MIMVYDGREGNEGWRVMEMEYLSLDGGSCLGRYIWTGRLCALTKAFNAMDWQYSCCFASSGNSMIKM